MVKKACHIHRLDYLADGICILLFYKKHAVENLVSDHENARKVGCLGACGEVSNIVTRLKKTFV